MGPRDVATAQLAPLDPCVIVVYGATGDLAKRKLLPGGFHLAHAGLMPEYRIVGVGREELSDDEFRQHARDACLEFERHGHSINPEELDRFVANIRYVAAANCPTALAASVAEAEAELPGTPRRLFHLSVPPDVAPIAVREIKEAGLVERSRVIMEKPFGMDLASARALNAAVHEVFDEEQVFRIDHFLGKEAAQNILALRFANGLFEPIWNRYHIDHIQIDVPETLGLEGRFAFYEETGAFRDMVVTHLFQVLGFVAMEPPTALAPGSIAEEKRQGLPVAAAARPAARRPRAIRGISVRGGRGRRLGDGDVRRPGVPDRQLALGRRAVLPADGEAHGRGRADHLDRVSRAAAEHVPGRLRGRGIRAGPPDVRPRRVLAHVAVVLRQAPGPDMALDKRSMQFSLVEVDREEDTLEAYERLMRDAMKGDHTLFTTGAGIERLWEVSEPLLKDPPPVRPYPPGSWGPDGIRELIAPRVWRLPFERRWREARVIAG